MSFICQVCHRYGDTPTRAVTKYEPITHPDRTDLGGYHDKGGEGWRIVSEVTAHPECGAKVAAVKPPSRKIKEA